MRRRLRATAVIGMEFRDGPGFRPRSARPFALGVLVVALVLWALGSFTFGRSPPQTWRTLLPGEASPREVSPGVASDGILKVERNHPTVAFADSRSTKPRRIG